MIIFQLYSISRGIRVIIYEFISRCYVSYEVNIMQTVFKVFYSPTRFQSAPCSILLVSLATFTKLLYGHILRQMAT